jgi:hypothetical protein
MEGLPPPPAMPPLTVSCVDGSVQTFPAPTFSWIDALTLVKGAKCGVKGLAPPPPIPVPRRDHTVPFAAYEAMDEVRRQVVDGRGLYAFPGNPRDPRHRTPQGAYRGPRIARGGYSSKC